MVARAQTARAVHAGICSPRQLTRPVLLVRLEFPDRRQWSLSIGLHQAMWLGRPQGVLRSDHLFLRAGFAAPSGAGTEVSSEVLRIPSQDQSV